MVSPFAEILSGVVPPVQRDESLSAPIVGVNCVTSGMIEVDGP